MASPPSWWGNSTIVRHHSKTCSETLCARELTLIGEATASESDAPFPNKSPADHCSGVHRRTRWRAGPAAGAFSRHLCDGSILIRTRWTPSLFFLHPRFKMMKTRCERRMQKQKQASIIAQARLQLDTQRAQILDHVCAQEADPAHSSATHGTSKRRGCFSFTSNKD